MKNKDYIEELRVWLTIPNDRELSDVAPPPRMKDNALRWWREEIEQTPTVEHPETSTDIKPNFDGAIVVCLEDWKRRNPNHPKVLRSRMLRGSIDELEYTAYRAQSHGDLQMISDQEHLSPYLQQLDLEQKTYSAGDKMVLELEAPYGIPHYITVLLMCGDEAAMLAYPHDSTDEYYPISQLEIEWEVEAGPRSRMFLVLFSEQPLIDTDDLRKTLPNCACNTSSMRIALANIDWNQVKYIAEFPWFCNPQITQST